MLNILVTKMAWLNWRKLEICSFKMYPHLNLSHQFVPSRWFLSHVKCLLLTGQMVKIKCHWEQSFCKKQV